MKKAICSIFDQNYSHQGNLAIQTAKKHNPDHDIILLSDMQHNPYADIVLHPNQLGLSDNWLIIGRIAIVEYILSVLDYDTAIFIDGDTYSYYNYNDLQTVTENHSIVVIPHITEPLPNDNAFPQNRIISLSGNYNTGVWSASKTGINFLKWWKEQTILFPITKPEAGLVNEQGWLRFAGDFDDNTKIFRHPGYNVAYWNIKQRHLTDINNIIYINDNPLSIIHFSGFKKEVRPEHMSIFQNRYTLDINEIAYKLYNDYSNLVWGSHE
jgi:hypothetical protein